jgi:CheY-like chemotaxis protein
MASDPLILLVEDDVSLIRRALEQAFVTNPVQVARDGEEALAYLGGKGAYADRATYPFPDLVLLDIKMPKMDGFHVLRWIRQQPGFNLLRVVVLTNSLDTREANAAYAAGANSFLVKPSDFQEAVRLMTEFAGQWLAPASST